MDGVGKGTTDVDDERINQVEGLGYAWLSVSVRMVKEKIGKLLEYIMLTGAFRIFKRSKMRVTWWRLYLLWGIGYRSGAEDYNGNWAGG